jgi:hypothetical protein
VNLLRIGGLAILIVAAAIAASHTSPGSASKPQPVVQAVEAVTDTAPPLRALVAIDDTLSMDASRTPEVSTASLGPLLDRMQASGGELAIGFIRERSDAPLLRLYIPSPPEQPVPIATVGDVFSRAKAKQQQEQQTAQYAADCRHWRADATGRINAFLGELAPLLSEPRDARRTDIRSMVVRADLFLAEPTTYSRPPRNIIIFITDGLDDVNTETPPPLASHADVLLVNGVGTVAYLAPLNPVRFESLDAALRFAVAEGGRHVR